MGYPVAVVILVVLALAGIVGGFDTDALGWFLGSLAASLLAALALFRSRPSAAGDAPPRHRR